MQKKSSKVAAMSRNKDKLLYAPLVGSCDLHNYYNEWHRATRLKNHKKPIRKVQKEDTGSHAHDSWTSAWCVWLCLTIVNCTNSERIDIYGRELWIERFPNRAIHVREHLRQWYSISKIMVPSSFKLTIVAIVPLKNKFWNASKKSPTSSLADLQLRLEFHSL